jgi:dipeptidyl aminopeptidase/acylaminoacyl peptidase
VLDSQSTVTNTSGCGLHIVNTDTSGITLTCMATSAGGTSSNSVTIKRDATLPTLAPIVSPNPVAQNAAATATPNASDALSGIASQSCPSVITSTLGSHSVQCTATDNAGNAANADANYQVNAISGIDIVFARTVAGSTKIWGMKADGTGQVQLTTGPEIDGAPSLSRDKTKIAFSRVQSTSSNYEIYSMNVDGTGLTKLTNSSGYDSEPAWSPDGTKIAYTSDRYSSFYPNYEIVVMNANGTNVTRLTNSPGIDWGPAWSPDGRKIAFTTGRYASPASLATLFTEDIAVMNADGTLVTRLTNNPLLPFNYQPTWSPDGTMIAFTDSVFSSPLIYTIHVDGTQLTRLTNGSSNNSEPAWGANGKILFASNRSGSSQIFSMNADGTKPTQLTNSGTNRSPSW